MPIFPPKPFIMPLNHGVDLGVRCLKNDTKPASAKTSDDRISASRRRELEVRGILDSVLSFYNNLEAQTTELPKELQDSMLQNWIASLRTQTGLSAVSRW